MPRMIMTIMAIAAMKRTHRPSSRHGMPSHMAQKVAKQADYVASIVGAFRVRAAWAAHVYAQVAR
jgi:hypothetical protein